MHFLCSTWGLFLTCVADFFVKKVYSISDWIFKHWKKIRCEQIENLTEQLWKTGSSQKVIMGDFRIGINLTL